MQVTGRVTAVEEDVKGTVITANASIGATLLHIDPTDDLDEDGGTLRIIDQTNGDQVLAYSAVDDDALTVTTDALTKAVVDGQVIQVEPLAMQRYALVALDDDSLPIPAVIPHNLIRRIPPGSRDEADREAVLLHEDNPGEWSVTDVLGRGVARPGFGETDWGNENGDQLLAGDEASGTPTSLLGTAVIVPKFRGSDSTERHISLPHVGYNKMGEAGTTTDAMQFLVERPSIIDIDADAYIRNDTAVKWNCYFTVVVTIGGVDSPGTPIRALTVANDDANTNDRPLHCMRSFYVDPGGTPVMVHLTWGYHNDSALNRDATVGGQKMRAEVTYAPDADPSGDHPPVWTKDATTRARYYIQELDVPV